VDRFIYVVPERYGALPEQDRYAVARLIGQLNRLQTQDPAPDRVMAIGPGRWGTSTPSLGIPVTGVDINHISILCEVAGMHEHLVPDISLGTHFFNELVEQDLLYVALFPHQGDNDIRQSFFVESPSSLLELLPSATRFEDVVRVIDVAKLDGISDIKLLADAAKQEVTCFCEK
jgi:hypothetical protein